MLSRACMISPPDLIRVKHHRVGGSRPPSRAGRAEGGCLPALPRGDGGVMTQLTPAPEPPGTMAAGSLAAGTDCTVKQATMRRPSVTTTTEPASTFGFP